MSSKTLLATLRAVTGETNFSQPIVVLSSQVPTDIQLRNLATAAGEELLDAYDWQALMRNHSFTVTSSTTYDLPADFHRIINQTAKVGDAFLDGSPTPAAWVRQDGGSKKYRIFGDKFELADAAQFVGQTVSFSYISKYFVIDGTNGLPKAEFTLDSDKTVYHPRLYTNLVKLKLLQQHDLPAQGAAAEDYNAIFEIAISADSPAPVLNYGGVPSTNSWEE